MAQIEEQNKIPGKELNKMETSNLSDAELKTMVIRMLKELSEDLSSIQNIHFRNKEQFIGNNNRVDEAENQINDGEHKEAKNNYAEQEEERIQKNENSVSNLWDNFKQSNIRFIVVPEREEKEQELEIYLKK